jgi:hypothetical protein
MPRSKIPQQPEPASDAEAALRIEQAMQGGNNKTRKYIERLRKQIDNGGAEEVASGLRAWTSS